MLLTGTHLMRTGRVEANLPRLNEEARLPYLDDLIGRKVAGAEKEQLTGADLAFHTGEYKRLREELRSASEASPLPETPRGGAALHDLLVRLRLRGAAKAWWSSRSISSCGGAGASPRRP